VTLDTVERLPIPDLGSTTGGVCYPGDIIRSGVRHPVADLSSTSGSVSTILMDLTIISVTCPSYNGMASSDAALRAAEVLKIGRRNASVIRAGYEFVALAFSHLGRPSPVSFAHLKEALCSSRDARLGFRLLLKRISFTILAHVAASMQAHATRLKPLASTIPHGGDLSAPLWNLPDIT
jgi:hypothetical protein